MKNDDNISAKILAHSVSNGIEMFTYELEYPRFIHSEFMTHRMLSKNAASSRAIPVAKAMDLILENPAMPVFWGKNQAGMQATEELIDRSLSEAMRIWLEAMDDAIYSMAELNNLGLHKQIANRICEPWSHIKVVVSGTEWDNFFLLRAHKDAQPEIHRLADVMLEAKAASTPMQLYSGEWHLPYVLGKRDAKTNMLKYSVESDTGEGALSLEDAIMVSVSCCAQASYRNNDDSVEKARLMVSRLSGGDIVHLSPFEHQATPMNSPCRLYDTRPKDWEKGTTAMDRNSNYWSGNLKGWTQYRQMMEKS
jgi:hypothetical protein